MSYKLEKLHLENVLELVTKQIRTQDTYCTKLKYLIIERKYCKSKRLLARSNENSWLSVSLIHLCGTRVSPHNRRCQLGETRVLHKENEFVKQMTTSFHYSNTRGIFNHPPILKFIKMMMTPRIIMPRTSFPVVCYSVINGLKCFLQHRPCTYAYLTYLSFGTRR